MPEICGKVFREEYAQEEPFRGIETQDIENQNTHWTLHHNINVNIRRHENIAFIKRIMTKKKTTLQSIRNQDWKKVKEETEKVNKLLKKNTPTDNITELNDQIYAGAKTTWWLNKYPWKDLKQKIQNVDGKLG